MIPKHPSRLLLLPLLLLLATPLRGQAVLIDRVACVVDGEVITLSEVEERVRILRTRAPDARMEVLYREAADGLIADRLLAGQLEALQIEVRPAELQAAIDDVIRQNGLPSEEALRTAVERQGMGWDNYQETLRKQLAQMKLINLKVRSQIKISEDEIRRRYAEYVAAEQGEEEVRASHLVFQLSTDASAEAVEAARLRAAEAADAVRAGADLLELAEDGSGSGGDLGWFRRGEMVRELEEVAFRLEPGVPSEPVRTRFGWHVLVVAERREVPPKSYEAMAASLRDELYHEELERSTQRYVEELKRNAVIEYPMAELAPPAAASR